VQTHLWRAAAPLAALAALQTLIAAQPAATLTADLHRALDRRLTAIVESLDGVAGYAALDLTTGDEIGRLENEPFPTASTIKLAILYELFRQADEGRLHLDAAAPLDRSHVVGGDGVLKSMGTPSLTLRDHAVLMITLSDNTATNVLIDRLAMAAITRRMHALGLTSTLLRRKMMDGPAAARGDENVSTPRDIVRLLRVLHTGEGLTQESKEGALKILEAGTAGWLRRGVPPNVEVLNKLGTLEGVRVDAAIVRAVHRPYAVAVMTTYLKDESEGERAIADISRAFYAYFSRLGFGSEYGRQMKKP
jgi:beta-lactamase class A